ncbi:hypothetical protein KSP39_PZI005079 [Platanthera zijinensis]|uniref:Uncharacterized protein n=1 Tax=Platanthera zijinensis TaxID=2320716 RepID=A0AAP0BSJ8_9ASPA
MASKETCMEATMDSWVLTRRRRASLASSDVASTVERVLVAMDTEGREAVAARRGLDGRGRHGATEAVRPMQLRTGPVREGTARQMWRQRCGMRTGGAAWSAVRNADGRCVGVAA